MQTLLIAVIALHVLAGVFWAGSTFALARTGAATAERLLAPQLGSAVLTVLSGACLWHFLHASNFGRTEQALAIASASAFVALVVQASTARSTARLRAAPDQADSRARVALAQRIAAALLAVAVIAMSVARFL